MTYVGVLWNPAFVLVLALTAPWLNPFAPGPSPTVLSLLFSWFCAAGLVGVWSASFGKPRAKPWTPVIAWTWLAAGLISSMLGLFQYFGMVGYLLPWVNQPELGEAFANLRQRNQFASLTNIALVALVWLMVKHRFSGRWPWLVWAAAGLLAAGNAASSSRTGLLQLVSLCVLCLLWASWRQTLLVRRVLLTAVLAYAVATLALPWLAGLDLMGHGMVARLRAGDPACASRLTLWSNVLHLVAQKPWFGWGWGELDYAHFITLYNGPRFCDILDNAHNLPLQLAVELGVPAALLICGVFTGWVVRQKPWAERDATRQMAWAVIALILLHSMLEYPLWYGPFQMAFGICIILLWRQKPPLNDGYSLEKQSNRPLARIFIRLFAITSIAFIGYAAWDYRRISQVYLEPESRSAAYRSDTLNKIRSSWLFADQVVFAELLTTPLRPVNAAWTLATAKRLLHYSPEPRVIEKLIESAVLLNQEDVALAHLARYKAAFPKEHALWAKANQKQL